MKLTHLSLRNFRSFKGAQFAFSEETNLIVGPNGRGKTNLLEAIYLLSTGRSFRTPHLTELIHHSASAFHIEATFEKESVTQTLSFTYDGKTRKLHHNKSSIQNLLGLLPSIIYAPTDIELISGSPATRRRFFNLHLSQKDPTYASHLVRYHRALKQRNQLLKSRQESTLHIWEAQLASSATYLMDKRLELTTKLIPNNSLTGNQPIHITYKPSLQSNYLEEYQKSRPRELLLGTTLLGPHRDDFTFSLNDRSAKSFSSEGEKRSVIASLKLAEWQLLPTPLLLIDDFATHLDPSRTALLTENLPKTQLFLTSPTPPTSLKPLTLIEL